MKRWALMGALLLFSSPLLAQDTGMAPDFTLQDVEGKTVQLSTYLGKNPILIDFWATWCNPCKTELPHLEAIYKENKDKGLIFLAISEDSPKSVAKVKPYVKSKNFEAIIPLDPDGSVLRKFFGDNTLPYTILIDRSGKIVQTFTGYVPGQEQDIAKLVDKVCAEESTMTPVEPEKKAASEPGTSDK
jgi:peroxiredoxin